MPSGYRLTPQFMRYPEDHPLEGDEELEGLMDLKPCDPDSEEGRLIADCFAEAFPYLRKVNPNDRFHQSVSATS